MWNDQSSTGAAVLTDPDHTGVPPASRPENHWSPDTLASDWRQSPPATGTSTPPSSINT
jgi:hypothetical protein